MVLDSIIPTRKRIKLGFIIDSIDSDMGNGKTGSGRNTRRFDRSKYDPVLICLASTPWLEDREVPCRKIVLDYKGFFHLGFPGFLNRLRRLFVREDFDILQAFFEDSLFLAFATRGLTSPPMVIASRRDIGLGSDMPWSHTVYELIRPFVMRRLDGVLTNGNGVKRVVMERTTCVKARFMWFTMELICRWPRRKARKCFVGTMQISG